MPIDASELRARIKLGERVFHDQPYPHPRDKDITCPSDFYGRQREKRDIFDHLRNPENRQPLIVQGERRMGKTSMLKLIEAQLKGDHTLLALRLTDGGGIQSLADLWSNMAGAILADAEDAGQGVDPVPAYPGPADASQTLRGLIRRWAPGKIVVFLWDEMDECLAGESLPENECHGILGFFASMHRPGFPAKLLLTMIRTPERIAHGDVRGFIDASKLVCLGPFDDAPDFAAMLQAPWDPERPFTQDQISAIHRASGGWPYFAKEILYRCADESAGPNRLQSAIDLAADYDPSASLTRTMRLIDEHHLDPHEKLVIRSLACRSGAMTSDELAKRDSELPQAAVRLRDRHYLNFDGKSYSFRVEMLGKWYRSSGVCAVGSTRRFRVALSFTSENDDLVVLIAENLAGKFGKSKVLYYKWHEAEFARPDFSRYRLELFATQSDLVVVFICENYFTKQWSGLEWKAIEKLMKKHPESVMLIRLDRTPLPNFWPATAGYLDARERTGEDLARLIIERWERL